MADKRLIPDGIRDDSTIAFNEIIDRLGNIDLTVLLVYLVDIVDESALPVLAKQFHIEGYDLADTIQKKRTLIKNAIEIHRYKGTRWAVKTALQNVNIHADVVEWFEPGGSGQPYTFNLKLKIEDDVNNLNSVLKLIDEVKNVRSKYYADFDIYKGANICIKSGIIHNVDFNKDIEIDSNSSLYKKAGSTFFVDLADAFDIEKNINPVFNQSSGIFNSLFVKPDFEIDRITPHSLSPGSVIRLDFYYTDDSVMHLPIPPIILKLPISAYAGTTVSLIFGEAGSDLFHASPAPFQIETGANVFLPLGATFDTSFYKNMEINTMSNSYIFTNSIVNINI